MNMKNIEKNKKQENFRWIIVDTIITYAWDEFDTIKSCINLAKKTENELLMELTSILTYYKENDFDKKSIDDMENTFKYVVLNSDY